MTPTQAGPRAAATGPVLFAYDGSELAALAVEQAGAQLATGREALVVCVWQPADVGFAPSGKRHFDASDATQVHQAAEETAAAGASLADKAGFGHSPWRSRRRRRGKGSLKLPRSATPP